ncbi:hypothetical protein Rhe02_26950 [Rhizocola hellebori]|uniref:Secreted protein n=1 Tax=Rhizocola hellebori TaxID=1392758 RepID=A0A8J3Q7D3_9ACTN|nr:hypothetical protein Rhe02_26950 [Rhizocola hellebori]
MAYLVIGCVFLVTAAYVLTVLPGRSAPPSEPAATPSPYVHSDGLSDSFEGYLIRPAAVPTARGKDIPFAFHILRPDGQILSDYETVQERMLHLYLVRDDMSGFQHLHPTLSAGQWSTQVTIDDGGPYRFYAEFTPKGRSVLGHPIVLGVPFVIAGDTKLAPMPAPASASAAGPYTVTRLDGTAHLIAGRPALLRFAVDAQLEPYLGALAHMSAFEVRTQALTHLHPIPSELAFHTQFANRGEYRLFMDFQVAGALHRAAFTIFVS